ncbi:hypothetical protein Mar181_0909 [Marinomonas posidonica IVIA-Po-181]|uniref:Uncharacterized protein n=2 Tax=Marinomonas TaxID=28253 RepID=F6CSW9_MARPP|nr:hypothetical protein Mar181_0909 [Marinomonas posidonica IVIA-Po-181]
MIRFLHMLIFSIWSVGVFAASSSASVELGVYASSITYTEPSVMEENGSLSGLNGRIIFQQANDFKALEITIASGKMDYEGSGTIQGIPDELFEIRGLRGSQWKVSSAWQVTPYIGLGYRYLNDDSSGMISSTSAYGYEREQVYYYSPIGIRFEHDKFLNDWNLYGSFEFDYFLLGKNTSYTGRLRGHNDLSFEQHEGFGNRIHLGLSKPLYKGLTFKVEAFYKYWSIEDSTLDYDADGTAMIEPKNHSKEMGISVMLAI